MRATKIVSLIVMAVAVIALLLIWIGGGFDHVQTSGNAKRVTPESTPADARILAAERMIKQAAGRPDGHNLLASAYMQKARETGDFELNARAEAALSRSLEVEPDNVDALILKAKLLLIDHRFREAVEMAGKVQAERPDDHNIYGVLTDGFVELGDYRQAVQAAQKMVDLRPDSASFARVAYLRSLHGDFEGAVAAMQVAVKSSDPRDPESVAWCRVHLGMELMNAGRRAEAEREYDKALLTFPGYKLALDAKARARIAAADINGAIQIYEKQADEPAADTALALGDLYAHLGRVGEAARQFEMFERLEPENARREDSWQHMINYWLDHDKNLPEALNLAQREYAVRKDVFTCDTLAWALFKNGKLADAKELMKEALRLGTRSGRIQFNSGMIANALGQRRTAENHLKLALEFDFSLTLRQAAIAKQTLAEFQGKTGR